MDSFKAYKKEKVNELLEHTNDYSKLRFKFEDSKMIDELLSYYVKDKGIDPRSVNKILQESSIAFDDLNYSDKNSASLHEDLIDVGYVIGYISAKTPGRLIGVDFDKFRYFYIGVESDIVRHLKLELNQHLKL